MLKTTTKEHAAPQFEVIRQEDSDRRFLAASAQPAPSVTGGIKSMTIENGAW